MSIYGTWLTIADERQIAASLAEAGINHGIIDEDGLVENLDDLPPDELDAPIVYEGSHVLPSDSDRRGGSVDVAAIPDFIERDGRNDAQGTGLKDWLRLGVSSVDSTERYRGQPYVEGGQATVVLTRRQVVRLRDTLTEWLDREPDDGEWVASRGDTGEQKA